MTTFKSIPNSSANQQFLQNIQSISKMNQVSVTNTIMYLQKRITGILQNVYDQKGVQFKSVQIEPMNGDLIINVTENGKLNRYVNPTTGLPARGRQMPFGAWEQHNGDVNKKNEPVDENGMTKGEYEKNEESLEDYGWDDILFGKSWSDIGDSWSEFFWGKPNEGEGYFERIDHLNDQLQNP